MKNRPGKNKQCGINGEQGIVIKLWDGMIHDLYDFYET